MPGKITSPPLGLSTRMVFGGTAPKSTEAFEPEMVSTSTFTDEAVRSRQSELGVVVASKLAREAS